MSHRYAVPDEIVNPTNPTNPKQHMQTLKEILLALAILAIGYTLAVGLLCL